MARKKTPPEETPVEDTNLIDDIFENSSEQDESVPAVKEETAMEQSIGTSATSTVDTLKPKEPPPPDPTVDGIGTLTKAATVTSMTMRDRIMNPLLPANPFYFPPESGWPATVSHLAVQKPTRDMADRMRTQYDNIVQHHRNLGWDFVKADWCTNREPRGNKIYIREYRVDEAGNILVQGCYIMFKDRQAYQDSRLANVHRRNDILREKQESREEQIDSQGRVRRVDSERQEGVPLSEVLLSERQDAGTSRA